MHEQARDYNYGTHGPSDGAQTECDGARLWSKTSRSTAEHGHSLYGWVFRAQPRSVCRAGSFPLRYYLRVSALKLHDPATNPIPFRNSTLIQQSINPFILMPAHVSAFKCRSRLSIDATVRRQCPVRFRGTVRRCELDQCS